MSVDAKNPKHRQGSTLAVDRYLISVFGANLADITAAHSAYLVGKVSSTNFVCVSALCYVAMPTRLQESSHQPDQ